MYFSDDSIQDWQIYPERIFPLVSFGLAQKSLMQTSVSKWIDFSNFFEYKSILPRNWNMFSIIWCEIPRYGLPSVTLSQPPVLTTIALS